MSKIKIIAGRICSLSYKFAKENDIHLIPANIMLKNFREATKDTDKAIHVEASSKLSNFYSRGIVAAKKLEKEGKDIRVFDTLTAVSMHGMFAYTASQLSRKGDDIDTILAKLKKLRDERRIVEYGVINTLKYLEKNGRIGKAKAWLANIFSFKPIISAKDGVLEPVGKVRTDPQALEFVVNKIKDDRERTKATKVQVMYDYGINDEFLRREVDPRIRKEFDAKVISFNQISTAIACHLGPEVWGVCVKLE
jgi:DegV family protein with EDD domain